MEDLDKQIMNILGANQLEQRHGYESVSKKAMQLRLLKQLIVEARIDELENWRQRAIATTKYFPAEALQITEELELRIKSLKERKK